ncbi:MAG: TIGR02996 domain-containing protein [Polyangiaceae bacterium]|nr:TIGR02996 domain-containing protein [Polyangiaceae bacterium]
MPKADPWIERARARDPHDLPQLFATLTSSSRPATERRLAALAEWPRTEAVGELAARLLAEFPFDGWGLGGATRAVGLAILHGAPFEALRATPLAGASEVVRLWRGPALEAARQFLARAHGLPPAGPFEPKPIPLRPRHALHAAWLDLAASRSLEALPALLEHFGSGAGTDICARALALLELPRDRRVAAAVVDLLKYPPVSPRPENPLFLALALLAAAHGDKSDARGLKDLFEAVPSLEWIKTLFLSTKAGKTVDKPSAAGPAPKGPAKPKLGTAASTPTSERTFLEWIADAPEDLERRAVFADWLSGRGDPRGEYIALALAASKEPPTPARARRLAALERQHLRVWLRSLDRCLLPRHTRLDNGFLSRAFLSLEKLVPKATDPLLATIEDLAVSGREDAAACALLASERLSRVRKLKAPPKLVAALNPRARERLTELSLDLGGPKALAALRGLAFPALEVLRLESVFDRYAPEEVFALSFVDRLRQLTIASAQTVQAWLEPARRRKIQALTVETGDLRYDFELSASAPRLTITLDDSLEPHHYTWLFRCLPDLDPGIRRGAVLQIAEGTIGAPQAARLRALGLECRALATSEG